MEIFSRIKLGFLWWFFFSFSYMMFFCFSHFFFILFLFSWKPCLLFTSIWCMTLYCLDLRHALEENKSWKCRMLLCVQLWRHFHNMNLLVKLTSWRTRQFFLHSVYSFLFLPIFLPRFSLYINTYITFICCFFLILLHTSKMVMPLRHYGYWVWKKMRKH